MKKTLISSLIVTLLTACGSSSDNEQQTTSPEIVEVYEKSEMEKLDNDYGPLLLGELQKRLESTIEEFHLDLKVILDKSFKDINFKDAEFMQ